MKRALLVLATLFATGAWAEDQSVKVFTVKPPNVERIQRTLKMVAGEQNVTVDSASATLVVKASPALMPAVEQVVKELDVAAPAAKDVELTFYILHATNEPAADSGPLPPALLPAIAQLKSVFAYKGFHLLDTAFIRTRGGDWANLSGKAEMPSGPSNYVLKLRLSVSAEAHPVTIRLDSLHFQEWISWTKGTSSGNDSIGFDSNVDLQEGQQAVIGKTSIEGNRSAIILVASGKIVE
ncbi:MAG TPA: hypothetical protein VN893_24440, partial [Bryobacteraceae bacterium]|nr:hypothetical protein [Bryobacteraceae bacterium]